MPTLAKGLVEERVLASRTATPSSTGRRVLSLFALCDGVCRGRVDARQLLRGYLAHLALLSDLADFESLFCFCYFRIDRD